VEDQEALKTGAVICDAADLVHNLFNELLADGVLATSVVVRGILLAGDQVFGVEEVAVRTGTNLIDDVRLEIDVDGTGDVSSLASLREEGGEAAGLVSVLVAVDGVTIRLSVGAGKG